MLTTSSRGTAWLHWSSWPRCCRDLEVAMRDVLGEIRRWYATGKTFGLATVVNTFRSAPRQPGAAMAVSAAGEVVGSVSGGCVEGAVYELAQEVIGTGEPVLRSYGVSDDDAFEVGLTCGGTIELFVEPVSVATAPDRRAGSLGPQRLDDAVTDDARGLLEHGTTTVLRYGAEGQRRLDDLAVFVQSFAPPPRMLVFGAIDFAAAVARIGKFLGFHVTVCDARPVFATAKRF